MNFVIISLLLDSSKTKDVININCSNAASTKLIIAQVLPQNRIWSGCPHWKECCWGIDWVHIEVCHCRHPIGVWRIEILGSPMARAG